MKRDKNRAEFCAKCINENENDCMYCVDGSRGIYSSTTVSFFPTCVVQTVKRKGYKSDQFLLPFQSER